MGKRRTRYIPTGYIATAVCAGELKFCGAGQLYDRVRHIDSATECAAENAVGGAYRFLRMKFAVAILCISLTALFADEQQLGEHARAAKAAEARHDYKTAIREYRALTKLVPDNPQLRTNLAIALYLDGDSAGA